ncbi:MAG TPA: penicillin acylase family protein [Candidatus Baltobacteraceae bacterium]|nr:penicillin acylase family protein [Candidatus Baltobacteraceae bacterium]
MRAVWRAGLAAIVVLVLAIGFVAFNVAIGMRAHSQTTGVVSGLGLRAPVSILRDARGVPHIIAQNERDLFFAQGYAEASDRLFQMDLQRRYVEGALAEVFGKVALHSDERERAVPVRAIVLAQWQRLDVHSRDVLQAFADGANAAMEREPLPVEFRLLAYRPQPWRPFDTLAIGMAEVLDLIDDWNEVANRDAAFRKGGESLLDALYPMSDPCYDAPVTAGLGAIGPGKPCAARPKLPSILARQPSPVGSNEWAAGAAHSSTGRALLANDPHLGLSIPGVWYLADLRAPGFHAAGATLAGVPAILLGHNDRVAWAMTDGTTASLSVFVPPRQLDPKRWRTETFGVRFGGHATQRFYSTPSAFGVTTDDGRFVLVKWRTYEHPSFAGTTFFDLDRARSIEDALAALQRYEGPTHNFAIADVSGRVAYVLAGPIPDDPLWARRVHPSADLTHDFPPVPWSAMPRVAPSRNGVVWTANNRVYGKGYAYRLSPQFAAPYRAYRIAQLLRAQPKYDVAYFTRMQMDALSLPELELAHTVAPSLQQTDGALANAFAHWNGQMTGDSTAATAIVALRTALTAGHKGRMPSVLADVTRAQVRATTWPAELWSIGGAVPVLHKLNALGIDFLNGVTLPGYGDEYTVHVQYRGYSQSFRAVWDVGNWDAGGITIPQGESGEPGSGHYTDQAAAWIGGRLLSLPFSDSAVQRTAVDRETLTP